MVQDDGPELYDAARDELDVEHEFWSRVPESRFARRPARRPARPARTPRPQPVVGRRAHDDTASIPVVPTPVKAAAQRVRTTGTHVDPLLRRMGVMAAAIALLVPVAMSLRAEAGGRATPLAPATSIALASTTVGADGSPTTLREVFLPAAQTAPATLDLDALPEAVPAHPDAPTTEAASSAPPATRPERATKAAAPARPACGPSYTIAAGDAWISIADRANVSLRSLLTVNQATAASALYPGRTICLPAGASIPVAKPAPKPSSKPTTTTTPSKPTPTTTKPYVPTTTYTRAQVEKIIRDIWPDDLEDEAVRIATRESNLVPTARNYCCYGLFQIYYSAHRTWLASLGITSANQLLDPKTNAYAALVLWGRSGSWAPWRL